MINPSKYTDMMQILYLDDDDLLLETFSDEIENWGFKIQTYSDPHKAFSEIQKNSNRYGVLLIDYKMPLVNGIDFIQGLSFHDYFNIENIALFSSLAFESNVLEELSNKVPHHSKKIVPIDKNICDTEILKSYLTRALSSKVAQV